MDTGPLRSRPMLHMQIAEYFSVSELKALCFEIEVDYETLPGNGKEEKALELVLLTNRHALLPRLLSALKQLRPTVDWRFLK